MATIKKAAKKAVKRVTKTGKSRAASLIKKATGRSRKVKVAAAVAGAAAAAVVAGVVVARRRSAKKRK